MNATWHLAPEIAFLLSILLALALIGMVILWVTRRQGSGTSRRSIPDTQATTSQPYERGFDLLLDARWREAAQVLRTAIHDDPTRSSEYLALGKLFRRRGDPYRAARMFEQLLTRRELGNATRITAQYELALAYHSIGWSAAAAELLEQILGINPAHAEARQELRRLHEELGQWETAAALEMLRLQRGETTERRTLAALLTQQGKAAWTAGHPQQGSAHLRSALTLDPSSAEAALHLGRLYQQQEKIQEALHVWNDLAKHRPEFLYLAFRDIQDAFRQLQNDVGWERFLRAFTERHPGDPTGHLALAEWYAAGERGDEAMHHLHRVLELDPLCREAHMALLSLYRAQGAAPAMLDTYAQLAEGIPQTCAGHCRCLACGEARDEPFGKCPSCHAWGAVERKVPQAHGMPILTGRLTPPIESSSPSHFTPLTATRDVSISPISDP